MTLYFAYGSNMSRAWMGQLCPKAHAGDVVHGVLWRIAQADLHALDRYEDVAGGLYDRWMIPVQHRGDRRTSLIYIGRSQTPGHARPEYCELLLSAARDWELPVAYVANLARELSAPGEEMA